MILPLLVFGKFMPSGCDGGLSDPFADPKRFSSVTEEFSRLSATSSSSGNSDKDAK